MHVLNLIVASATLALPQPVSSVPSVALPGRLHSLCNHVLSPSDEKLISIHSYQREASSHCWHRWECCVCSLYFWAHRGERERLMFLVLWVKAQGYSDEWVCWCFYYYMHFCLSDRADQVKHQLHLLLKTLSTGTIYAVWDCFVLPQDGMYPFGSLIIVRSQSYLFLKNHTLNYCFVMVNLKMLTANRRCWMCDSRKMGFLQGFVIKERKGVL